MKNSSHHVVFFDLLPLHLSSFQIFSSEPCSQTPPVSLNVRDQVLQPYRTTGKIILLYIVMFLISRWEDKKGLDLM
jgi:hypothetical protein